MGRESSLCGLSLASQGVAQVVLKRAELVTEKAACNSGFSDFSVYPHPSPGGLGKMGTVWGGVCISNEMPGVTGPV